MIYLNATFNNILDFLKQEIFKISSFSVQLYMIIIAGAVLLILLSAIISSASKKRKKKKANRLLNLENKLINNLDESLNPNGKKLFKNDAEIEIVNDKSTIKENEDNLANTVILEKSYVEDKQRLNQELSNDSTVEPDYATIEAEFLNKQQLNAMLEKEREEKAKLVERLEKLEEKIEIETKEVQEEEVKVNQDIYDEIDELKGKISKNNIEIKSFNETKFDLSDFDEDEYEENQVEFNKSIDEKIEVYAKDNKVCELRIAELEAKLNIKAKKLEMLANLTFNRKVKQEALQIEALIDEENSQIKKKKAEKAKENNIETKISKVTNKKLTENIEEKSVEIEEPKRIFMDETTDISESFGKYVIAKNVKNPIRPYTFKLFANNGVCLYESDTYKVKPRAFNVQTFRKHLITGYFTTEIDKKGIYRCKLYTAKGVLLGIGQPYNSKQNCEANIISIKKFALTAKYIEDCIL